ncbi:50S ribosomal protein L24 [Stieleria bergensis]|uniref:Large ribosomal subunit protein uL24 n=1 Tax=Stieleria bergensis TaxID=2528025 RepID=A0A517SRH8_9BACT|nr:MAG: 50S ribosomal protein L24 [Rhodopirellula sp. TMED11]QDT58730.1 50S ribosomal protein L24 [Planctomycetes bacterium SV_7m_r]
MLLKVDDVVEVIAGGDKGHRGKILVCDRKKNKVVVEGAGLVLKHVARSQKNTQGGRLSKEMPIQASNVMYVEQSTGQTTRLGVRYLEDGSKERYAKKSGASLGKIAPARDRYKKA